MGEASKRPKDHTSIRGVPPALCTTIWCPPPPVTPIVDDTVLTCAAACSWPCEGAGPRPTPRRETVVERAGLLAESFSLKALVQYPPANPGWMVRFPPETILAP